MPSTYAGSNVLHGSVLLPSDGDPAVAESVNVALRSLQDDSIYFTTELGHVAADDRGGTHALTGPIIWNTGSAFGRFQANVPVTLTGVVVATAPVTIFSTGGFQNQATSNLRGNVNIGSGPSQSLIVNATTDMYAPLSLHDDATFGHTVAVQDLIVDGSLDVDADAQVTHSGQMLTVGGGLTVNQDTQFNATVRSSGSTHWGDSSTDGHLFSGGVSMQQTLDVAGALTVEGPVTFNSSPNDLGGSAIVGDLTTLGSVTLGNTSSDTITTNAQLVTPLVCQSGSPGRVPRRPYVLPNSNAAIFVTLGDIFYANAGVSDGAQYTLQTSGATDGDQAWFSNASGVSIVVNSIAIPANSGTNNPTWSWWMYMAAFGGWRVLAHS